MRSNSASYNICAEVSSWKYLSSVSAPGQESEMPGPQIHIDAAVLIDYTPDGLDIEKGLLLCLSVIDNETSTHSAIIPSFPWELELFPQDDNPPLPKHLSAELTVPEETIRDMRNCLFLTANSSGSVMQIQLTAHEKESTPGSIAERTFSIIEFCYELIHRRNEI